MEINSITFLSYNNGKHLHRKHSWKTEDVSSQRCCASLMFSSEKNHGTRVHLRSPPCRFVVSLKIIASTLRMYHVYAVKISRLRLTASIRGVIAFLWKSGKFETFFFFFDSTRIREDFFCIRTGRHLNLTVSGSRHRQLDFRDRMRRSKEILSVPRKFCWGQDTRWSTLKVDERYHGVNGVPRN